MRSLGTQALALLAGGAPAAHAHEGAPLAPHDLWRAWDWNPAVTVPFAVAAALYAVGARRVWARTARGRAVRRRDAAAFAAGWVALVAALVSPLHALGGALFSAHMTQHELMMVVAAPLLVLGRPLVPFVWAWPPALRRRIGAWTTQTRVRGAWRALTTVGVAWWTHAAALAVWHVPRAYEATLASPAMHVLQHASFLGTALLFWWAVLHRARARRAMAVVYLFVATLVTGALGALLTFAPELWYRSYAATTGTWGLTPLEDQQLGGIIMWIPGSAAYLIAALVLVAVSLGDSERSAVGTRPLAARAGRRRRLA